MDVKSAYLNGDLEEDIYMEQPEGYVTAGKEQLVCKCNDHGISNRIFYPFVVLLFLRWISTVSVGVGRHADFRY
jgi:hypothetical protein